MTTRFISYDVRPDSAMVGIVVTLDYGGGSSTSSCCWVNRDELILHAGRMLGLAAFLGAGPGLTAAAREVAQSLASELLANIDQDLAATSLAAAR